MAIRPVDIRRKEFKSGFRGYDANQVDDFLDEVADEFERTFSENQRMSEEITSLQERLQQFEELEASIREALVHAQQVSQDLPRVGESRSGDCPFFRSKRTAFSNLGPGFEREGYFRQDLNR